MRLRIMWNDFKINLDIMFILYNHTLLLFESLEVNELSL